MVSQFASDRQPKLEYVCDMLEQLKLVSGASGGSILAYLMDMAKLEAESEMLRHRDGEAQPDGSEEDRDPPV